LKSSRLVISTPSGPAWVDLDVVPAGRALLVIGHGAGGTVDSPDLLAVRAHCLELGINVARVTQPYRVAGKKAPPTAASLDAAWSAVITNLGRRKALAGLNFIYAGRSSGARVACRTAADPQLKPAPIAVLALAFPVHPPGKPEKSRLDELNAVPVPVLVVQGDRDPFGMPPKRTGRRVATVAGDHSLKREADSVGVLAAKWIAALR
jgi:predicted alpha/beta-hydrolase family hydrolase